MRVFVAGATGVIGHRAVRALVAAGHDVTAAVRSPEKAALARSLGRDAGGGEHLRRRRVARRSRRPRCGLQPGDAHPALARGADPHAWDENTRIRTRRIAQPRERRARRRRDDATCRSRSRFSTAITATSSVDAASNRHHRQRVRGAGPGRGIGNEALRRCRWPRCRVALRHVHRARQRAHADDGARARGADS